ncbi:MAG: SMP-30/gluconolactonase/LRE family protein [Sphingobium sp.]|nr:SMP-30/gluconolactonase/LRE family protein [Sphingobium sp.]
MSIRFLAFVTAMMSGVGGISAADAASPVRAIEKVAHCGGFLEGAAFDAQGNLWVVDLMSGNVSVVRSGKCEVVVNTGGAPNGARFHKDGRLFITDNKKGLLALDTRTKTLSTIVDTYDGKQLSSLNDLVFDTKGGMYITDPNGSTAINRKGRLFYLSAEGRLSVIADTLSFPNGVALSPDGAYVYVGQFTDKSILMIPSLDNKEPLKAAFVHVRTVGGLGPDGMVVTDDGHLIWAQFGDGGVGVADARGRLLPGHMLPEGAGLYVTNIAMKDGWAYVTEAQRGDVWRIPIY